MKLGITLPNFMFSHLQVTRRAEGRHKSTTSTVTSLDCPSSRSAPTYSDHPRYATGSQSDCNGRQQSAPQRQPLLLYALSLDEASARQFSRDGR